MGWFRVTNPSSSVAVAVPDLGISIAASAVEVLSDHFSPNDLYLSADLESLIRSADLDVEIDYGTGYQAIAAADYTNRDALGAFLNVYEITNENNNEDLVDGSDVNASGPSGAALHVHDARYYTETEMGAHGATTPGASLVGADETTWNVTGGMSFTTVQGFIDGLYTWLTSGAGMDDLDTVYDHDSDGIMNVDGTTKPLKFLSNNANDILISRKSGSDEQAALQLDVSADELILGALLQGALAQIDVHVLSNLVVDGNVTFTGTITDTTVSDLEVTDANILLRKGAATGANASLMVERGSTGADADLLWDETADRWKAGVVGSEQTIALLEADEDVTGEWLFEGGSTDPNFMLLEKSAAPSTGLGSAGQIGMAMMGDGLLAIYDKSNSRNKWLSVERQFVYFTGRDNANNVDEYAQTCGAFKSNQAGYRVMRDACIVGVSVQSNASATWNVRVRKNGVVTNIATLAVSAAKGATLNTYNVNVSAGDDLEVYLDSAGVHVDRPIVTIELAYRF